MVSQVFIERITIDVAIPIDIEEKLGLWYVTSPMVKDLLLIVQNRNDVVPFAIASIGLLTKANMLPEIIERQRAAKVHE